MFALGCPGSSAKHSHCRVNEMKSNVRRLMVILGVIAVLVAAGIVAMIFIGRPAAFRALPSPNGYDDLLKAGQAVTGKIDDAPDLDREGLRALVTTNAEALRLLRVGLARDCAVPTDALIANFGAVTWDMIGLKRVAKLLSAEGRLAENENRPADAARSYTDSMRLGNEMSRGGVLINRLVGIACEGMGIIRLVKLLPKLNCEQMRVVVGELEQIDERTVPWHEVMENENRFTRAQMGKYPNPIKLVSDLWQARSMRQGARKNHDLAAAHLRLLIVELALRSYKCDQGSGPGNLTQLVPKYFRQVPTDPFSGKPLIYRLSGTNWLLYSLGPDRVDDGGKPIGKSQKTGDVLYDSAW
jgi:hypothetical protein